MMKNVRTCRCYHLLASCAFWRRFIPSSNTSFYKNLQHPVITYLQRHHRYLFQHYGSYAVLCIGKQANTTICETPQTYFIRCWLQLETVRYKLPTLIPVIIICMYPLKMIFHWHEKVACFTSSASSAVILLLALPASWQKGKNQQSP